MKSLLILRLSEYVWFLTLVLTFYRVSLGTPCEQQFKMLTALRKPIQTRWAEAQGKAQSLTAKSRDSEALKSEAVADIEKETEIAIKQIQAELANLETDLKHLTMQKISSSAQVDKLKQKQRVNQKRIQGLEENLHRLARTLGYALTRSGRLKVARLQFRILTTPASTLWFETA